MAKILISSIGTGPVTDTQGIVRKYRSAEYRIDGKPYRSSFIASALVEHLDIDDIFLIGTVKSMWEAVYEHFCETRNHPLDEEYYLKLAETSENGSHQSHPDDIDLQPIEQILGERSRCVAIHYGLNESELQVNFQRIFTLINSLERNDEIYIDITHSFRSLSLFLFLVLTFLNDLASDRNIQVKGVYYGMLDVYRELNHAPIINLQPLFDITRWIKGGYSFQNFGNGYLIASLLQESGDVNLGQSIEQLSNTLNLNYIPKLQQDAIQLRNELKASESTTPLQYLQPELERFTKQFARTDLADSQLQLKLASWYFDNKRYATGYIALVEAIITYVCEFLKFDKTTNYSKRQEAKDFLATRQSTSLGRLYFQKVNPIRKAIAHAALEDRTPRYQTAIENASQYLDEARRIFGSQTLG